VIFLIYVISMICSTWNIKFNARFGFAQRPELSVAERSRSLMKNEKKATTPQLRSATGTFGG